MSDDATSQLPAEILACIFDHASDWNLLQKWNPDDIGYCDPDSLPTELTYPVIGYLPALSLGATCSKWRAIAISYPDIWSRLKLEISVGKAKPDQEFIAMLELFLSRSGQQPLVIDLNIQGQESQSNFVNLVIDLLRRHSSRWKEFRFRGDSFTRDRKLARPILSMLETLSLQWDWTEDADILYLQSAPKLRRISSGMLSFYVIKFMVSPEFWERIVSLDVMISGSFSLKTVVDFLPNLTSLKLREFSKSSACVRRESRKIETLAVEVDYIADVDGLLKQTFASFMFPALKELHISCAQRPNSECPRYTRKWPRDSFAEFLSCSSCSITTLIITAVGLSDTDLLSALHHNSLSSLKTLELSHVEASPKVSPITSHFISSLHVGSDSHSELLVPRLSNLSLDFSGCDFDDQTFVLMISSRWLPDPELGVDCLRSVVLRFHEREVVEKTVYSSLQDLDRMGLRVVVRGLNGIIV